MAGLSADVLLKKFWRNPERFADLFNGGMFGRCEILPESLEEQDTDVSEEILTEEFQVTLQRRRDVVKIAKDGRCYRILGIEDQQKTHYIMPLRVMVYDALTYLKQYDVRRREIKKQDLAKTSEEILSGFLKTDRMIPCYTLVVYWGEKSWDGPLDLKDMMAFQDEETKQLFSDYHMNLICARELDGSRFQDPDVRKLFQCVQGIYASDEKNISDELRNVDKEIALTAIAAANAEKQLKDVLKATDRSGKETVDMCEALERRFARERSKGRDEVRDKDIVIMLNSFQELNMPEEASRKVMSNMGVDQAAADEYIKKYWKS